MLNIKTSIALMLPLHIQHIVMPLIRASMPASAGSYTAHITLLYPFIAFNENEKLDAACLKLHRICDEVSPIEVTLADYEFFPRVATMKIRNPDPIKALMQRIWRHFPEYPPYEGAYGMDIMPHVTIAHLSEGQTATSLRLPDYEPVTFAIDRLHVNYGVPGTDLPWLTHDVIRFNGEVSPD
ncbi:MAG: 2'-5' RNA ligase family protein [Aggregatilineales bacterium]